MSWWRSTSAAACRRSRSWASRTRRCGSRASGCGPRSATPGFEFPQSRDHGQPRACQPAEGGCRRSTWRSRRAILVASGQLAARALDEVGLAGELALDGSIRPDRRSVADGPAGAVRGPAPPRRAPGQRRGGRPGRREPSATDSGPRPRWPVSSASIELKLLETHEGLAIAPVPELDARAGEGARPSRPARAAGPAPRAGGRRGRRAQRADAGPAWCRQVHGSSADALDPAAARARRGHRGARRGERLRDDASASRRHGRVRSERPTTRSPARAWSAAARRHARASSAAPTAACSSSTSCPSSRATPSRRCVSRSRTGGSSSRAHATA